MLYVNIALLGKLVLILYVKANQSPVKYYQIIKKNVLDAMGIEPATYVLNHYISVVLPCFILNPNDTPISTVKQIHNYDNGRVTLVRKIQNIELCIPYQYYYQLATRKSSFKLKGYSERAIKKNVLVAWVTHKAGIQCSVRSSSLATLPYSMKKLLTCFHFSPHVQQSITTVLQPQKREFASFNFIVLNLMCHALFSAFNVPDTNFSIKQLRGKNHERYRTGPDQLYPEAFSLRLNRVLFVLAIFNRVIDEKMLALQLRTSAT